MAIRDVEVVDAFIDGEVGGNPAGVVFDADDLTPDEMQRIAAGAGFSETAFVSRKNENTFRLDFFTPNKRINACGHATVGTFSLLSQRGKIQSSAVTMELNQGAMEIRLVDSLAFMQQHLPEFVSLKAEEKELFLASLGLSAAAVDSRFEPMIVSTGGPFYILGVKDRETLKSITPNFAQVEELSNKHDLIGYYVFSADPFGAERIATTRMFAPRYGIEEESATGMAAGALGAYLNRNLGVNTMVIEQGYLMVPESPSEIKVEVKVTSDGAVTGVVVGGTARSAGKREVSY